MSIVEWIELVIIVLNGALVIFKLCQSGAELFKEKQWNKLVDIMLDLMVEAEKQFTEGAAKKAWVLNELRVAAKSLEYDYNAEAERKVSEMIDAFCMASKEIQKGHEV